MRRQVMLFAPTRVKGAGRFLRIIFGGGNSTSVSESAARILTIGNLVRGDGCRCTVGVWSREPLV